MRIALSAWLAACLTVCAAAPAADAASRKVLIISVDGCRPDALQAANAPNIKALFEGAAFSWKAQAAAGVGDYPVSGSSYSSMLTGVWCAKHGVCENDFSGNHYAAYPVFFCHVKAAQPAAVIESIVRWSPLSPNLIKCADVNLAPGSDSAAADEGVRLLTDTDPTVLFFHLEDVDTAGHNYGFSPTASGYLSAIATADGRVGRVIAALRARPAFAQEGWLIILLTDHGGEGSDHHKLNCPACNTVFMALNGPHTVPGEIVPAPVLVDVAVTAMTYLGVAIDPAWNLDGHAIGLAVETPRQLPGDCTADGVLNLSDAICLLSFLFLAGQPALPCGDGTMSGDNAALLDSNGDAGVDISDAVHLLIHIFAGGPPPAAGAGCVSFPTCPGWCS